MQVAHRRSGFVTVAALVLLCAGCRSSAPKFPPPGDAAAGHTPGAPAGAAAPAGPYQLSGTISAPHCDEGYDITGAPVTVRDEHDAIIAATVTSQNVRPKPTPPPEAEQADIRQHGPFGASEQARADAAAFSAAYDACLAQFSVSVPRAAFYQVTIGTHGGRPYSFDELAATGFTLALSLE